MYHRKVQVGGTLGQSVPSWGPELDTIPGAYPPTHSFSSVPSLLIAFFPRLCTCLSSMIHTDSSVHTVRDFTIHYIHSVLWHLWGPGTGSSSPHAVPPVLDREAGSSFPAGNTLPSEAKNTTNLLSSRTYCWLMLSSVPPGPSCRAASSWMLQLFGSGVVPLQEQHSALPHVYGGEQNAVLSSSVF